MDTGNIAVLVTAAVALAGVLATIWKQLAQQAADRRRQLDDKFNSIISNLGAESPAMQASAAVSIISFLKPEYEVFHDQVFIVLLARLKLKPSDVLSSLLIRGFEKAIRIRLGPERHRDAQFELDFSHCNLYRVNLSGLNLNDADLGFANLRGADLTDATLRRVKGWKADLEKARLSRTDLEEARFRKAHFKGAQFHDARLISARLEETDLTKAEFYKAKMQGAHLDGANLKGARFEQAYLSDTSFKGTKNLDSVTLRSISRAYDWQKAKFDSDIEAKLEEVARSNV